MPGECGIVQLTKKRGAGEGGVYADHGHLTTAMPIPAIAISDPTGFLTETTTTIHSRKAEEVAGEIARLVQEHGVEELVMGYPRNMDGTEGPRAELYRDFAALVEDTAGLRPVLWDERRTTVDAHRILFEAGKNARKRKKTVDAVAASLILEGYLDHRRLRG